MSDTIFILGACGQVGTELTENLQEMYGASNVVASDIKENANPVFLNSPFEVLDVLDKARIAEVFEKHKPTVVYHLAALLSATSELKPQKAWEVNMQGTLNIFDACLEHNVNRVFWPSSIAVFGPTTPRVETPQTTILEPNTIYGISKLAGERYCEYYFNRYGLDVRSIRYPGLVGYKSMPGGGTTDYAVEIFHKAIELGKYECFLGPETSLPMMHTEDAIRATIQITNAPAEQIKIRSSYNLGGVSFNPAQLAEEIKKHLPNFEITYAPDARQKIADSWPQSISDIHAQQDWGWKIKYDLPELVNNLLENINERHLKRTV